MTYTVQFFYYKDMRASVDVEASNDVSALALAHEKLGTDTWLDNMTPGFYVRILNQKLANAPNPASLMA